MTRWSKLSGLFLFVLFLHPLFSKAQQNLFDYGNSLKFARYLSTTKQFGFAAEEYERLNFLNPNDTTVVFELVQTYRLGRRCDKLQPSFGLLAKENRILTNASFTKEYLRFVLDCKIPDNQFFELVRLLPSSDKVFYSSGYFWVNRQSDSLFSINRREASLLSASHPDLYNLTIKYETQKYKKPALALMMSAIVPGSGKAYVKRWGDAIFSFLFVGTNAYASYRAFHKKGIKSANGWIFGGLAFSFYSANLYGSAKAARNYNATIRETYQKNGEKIIYDSY